MRRVTRPHLWGRDDERQELARLLGTARLGVGGTLAVTGEAGAGKSALVDDAVAAAEGLRVLRAVGLDAERHLPFAGLLQLLRPALDRLEDLAHPQAEALAGALGLSEEPPGTGDRFMIGAAVLGLLARYAEDGPVVVVVDDLQALDLPSVEAILFSARRLAADPVAVLLAARSPDADHLLVGFPVSGWVGSAATRAPPSSRRRSADRCRPASWTRCSPSPTATPWPCSSSPARTSMPSPRGRATCRRGCRTR